MLAISLPANLTLPIPFSCLRLGGSSQPYYLLQKRQI